MVSKQTLIRETRDWAQDCIA